MWLTKHKSLALITIYLSSVRQECRVVNHTVDLTQVCEYNSALKWYHSLKSSLKLEYYFLALLPIRVVLITFVSYNNTVFLLISSNCNHCYTPVYWTVMALLAVILTNCLFSRTCQRLFWARLFSTVRTFLTPAVWLSSWSTKHIGDAGSGYFRIT